MSWSTKMTQTCNVEDNRCGLFDKIGLINKKSFEHLIILMCSYSLGGCIFLGAYVYACMHASVCDTYFSFFIYSNAIWPYSFVLNLSIRGQN